MSDFGGIVSFEVRGSETDAKKLVSATKIFTLAESLGSVESLIEHPVSMTHASVPEPERLRSGLSSRLIRLSVGIEDEDDLIQNFRSAPAIL